MTPDLLKTIIIVIPLLFFGIALLRMLQQGKIKNITAGKDGIAIDMNSVDKRMESKHYLDKLIREIDGMIEFRNYKYTIDAGRELQRIINRASSVCTPTLYMASEELRKILYQALRENDFKNKLAKANRKNYIEDKLRDMGTAYDDMLLVHERQDCSISNKEIQLPGFDSIKEGLVGALGVWTDNIRKTITSGCEKKIESYTQYMQVFMEAKDEYFINVVKNCIEKNKKYIEALSD